MGKNSIITPQQRIILDSLQASDLLKSIFYFTGGTALSEVYLQHRQSVDLDFFSDNPYDPLSVFNTVSSWAKQYNFQFESQFVDPTHIYILNFGDEELKIDFLHYPFKRLKEGTFYHGLEVDSKLDIATNKLLLVGSQRIEAKDFVDLYFLLQEFSVWDLLEAVRIKFHTKLEPFVLASDFMVVEDFEFLPKMIRELNLEDLKMFFINEAKKLGKTVLV